MPMDLQSPHLRGQQRPASVEQTLMAIATHLHIASDGCLHLPPYPPYLPQAEVAAHHRQLPLPQQRRYLQRRLRDYIYDIFYSQELLPNAELDGPSLTVLQNDQTRGLNREFYQQLHDANQGQGYFDAGWQVLHSDEPGYLVVQRQDLTVQIRRDRHLAVAHRSATPGDWVAVWLPKNLLEHGLYVAVGDRGDVPDAAASLEISFHISSAGAIALMRHLTAAFNQAALPFSLRLLYNPLDYGRCDAAILRLACDHYATAHPLLLQVYRQVQAEVTASVSLFTYPLAPGVGLAEEPDDSAYDFGQHRCQLVAQGLMQAHSQGQLTPSERWACIQQQFEQQGLDLDRPYLNPGSADSYSKLDHGLA